MREPIFILWARSFWFGILPLLLVGVDVVTSLVSSLLSADMGLPVAIALATVANLVGSVFGANELVNVAAVESVMVKLAPLFGLVVAHQRSGAARPYSMNPKDAK